MSTRTSLAFVLVLIGLVAVPMLVGAYGGQSGWPDGEMSSLAVVSDRVGEGSSTFVLGLTPLTTPTATPPPPVNIRIKFEGVIKSIDDSGDPQVWVIEVWGMGQVTVLVPSSAEIDEEHGQAVPGAWVKVEAHLEPAGDGTSYNIVADEIEVKRSPEVCFKIEFYGELTEITTDPNTGQTQWTVSGRTVIITEQTQIEGTPVVGAIVKIEGCVQPDGTIIAVEVEVRRSPGEGGEEVEFRGPIVEITDTQWQVGRWIVLITSETQITGDPPDVGDLAEVEGYLNDLGQVVAEKIEVKDRGRGRVHVRIEGYITRLADTEWQIQGIPIQITETTIVAGIPAEVGVWAKADVVVQRPAASGLQQTDVTYVAVRIRTHRSDKPDTALKFTGTVDNINGNTWTVSGWDFTVTDATQIEGGPASPGDWVEIEAEAAYDATGGTWTYVAVEIEVKRRGDGGGGEPRHGRGVKIKGRLTVWDPDSQQGAVEGIPFTLGPLTIIDERDVAAAVDVWVEVKAMVQDDGSYLALEVETDDEPDLPPGQLRFEGQLDSMNGTWVVAGWPFVVDDETTVMGSPVVGSRVRVTATWDGTSHHADVIEVREHHE